MRFLTGINYKTGTESRKFENYDILRVRVKHEPWKNAGKSSVFRGWQWPVQRHCRLAVKKHTARTRGFRSIGAHDSFLFSFHPPRAMPLFFYPPAGSSRGRRNIFSWTWTHVGAWNEARFDHWKLFNDWTKRQAWISWRSMGKYSIFCIIFQANTSEIMMVGKMFK